jgi:N-acetylmuramoyl-L-alanine amidase
VKARRIIVHHSASHPRSTTFELIDRWHRARNWRKIGYHVVIECGGETKLGRLFSQRGAHVKGHNAGSIGICVTGDNTVPGREWNDVQRAKLVEVVRAIRLLYGPLPVLRHCDLVATECPGLSDEDWSTLEGEWNHV